MNYLAHATLSFNRPDILTGNMISDFVKGKKQYDFEAGIFKGIQLHKAIDLFTDNHEATKEMKEFYRPAYRLYAGAFCDVTYDHFLANDGTEFDDEGALQHFAVWVYAALEKNEPVLPETFKQMLPWMKTQNWLYNYRNLWGTEKSFAGLVKRTKYLTDSHTAFEIFTKNYNKMQIIYQQFFPEIKLFAANQLQRLIVN